METWRSPDLWCMQRGKVEEHSRSHDLTAWGRRFESLNPIHMAWWRTGVGCPWRRPPLPPPLGAGPEIKQQYSGMGRRARPPTGFTVMGSLGGGADRIWVERRWLLRRRQGPVLVRPCARCRGALLHHPGCSRKRRGMDYGVLVRWQRIENGPCFSWDNWRDPQIRGRFPGCFHTVHSS